MPNSSGQPSASKLGRYTVFALLLILLSHGDNLPSVQAREDFMAGLLAQTVGPNFSAHASDTWFTFIERQSTRYRRKWRRRRARKAVSPPKVKTVDSARSGGAPAGPWGGEHITLQVTESGGTFEIDCAHGTIEGRLSLDAQGRFDSPGTYVSESGGPDREGHTPAINRARYTGWSDGRRMTL